MVKGRIFNKDYLRPGAFPVRDANTFFSRLASICPRDAAGRLFASRSNRPTVSRGRSNHPTVAGNSIALILVLWYENHADGMVSTVFVTLPRPRALPG